MLVIHFNQDVVTLSNFKIGRKGARRTMPDTELVLEDAYDEERDSVELSRGLILSLRRTIWKESRNDGKGAMILYQSRSASRASRRQRDYERIGDSLKLPVILVKDCGELPFSLNPENVYLFFRTAGYDAAKETRDTVFYSIVVGLLVVALIAVLFIAVFVVNGGVHIRKGEEQNAIHILAESMPCNGFAQTVYRTIC